MTMFQDNIVTLRKTKSAIKSLSWNLRKIFITFVLIMLTYIIVYHLLTIGIKSRISQTRAHRRTISTENSSSNKSLNMPFCKFPPMDPYDPSIRHIVKKTWTRKCPKSLSLTFQEGFHVKINWTVAKLPPFNGLVSYCTYTQVYRPRYEITNNNYFRYLNESLPFYDSVKIDHEFVKINCYNTEQKLIYENFYGFIQHVTQSTDALYDQQFRRHVALDKVIDPMNVIMVGLDSVSRSSFIRQMVKTRGFLEKELETFDMMSYNKVAENTFVNIVPMTLGKFVREMSWGRLSNKTFDEYDFIWKQFSDKGYRTFFAEDAPFIATFDYLKAGFKTPPTDHFYRPMSVAMEMKKQKWSNKHHCFVDRLETDIVLKYLSDFIETYQHVPYFAFNFIARITHDFVNSPGEVDESYFKFFTNLHERNLLKNSIVFFYSDHGMRFGKIRTTKIGKLEAKLPFMNVIIPKWFGKKYPKIKNMLKMNQNRLSTPFDVYETLKDILYLDGTIKTASDSSRGISWFRELPLNRSCEQAGILPNWCACMYHKTLSTSDPVVVKSSSTLLEVIQHRLQDYASICENLSLYQIRDAVEIMNTNETDDDDWISYRKLKHYRDFQVVIETIPGNAVFEGTIRMNKDNGVYKVIGDISRINLHGSQADCIKVFELKIYCYCNNSHVKSQVPFP